MNKDNPFKSLLQDWRVSPQPHVGFRQGVWERIAAQSARPHAGTWASIGQWVLVSLQKPAYACAFVAAFALAGIAIADMRAATVQQRQSVRLEQRYLASIDPVAMANSALNPRP